MSSLGFAKHVHRGATIIFLSHFPAPPGASGCLLEKRHRGVERNKPTNKNKAKKIWLLFFLFYFVLPSSLYSSSRCLSLSAFSPVEKGALLIC